MMDIEEYCDRLKEGKNRKSSKLSSKWQTKPQHIVTKHVIATDDWNTERVNEYCEAILTDGGIAEYVWSNRNSGRPINVFQYPYHNTAYSGISFSLKKQKRWTLCSTIEREMKDQVASRDNWAPHVTVVERSIQPNKRRGDVSRALFTRLDDNTISPKNPENESSERECIVRHPKKMCSTTTDLLGYTTKKKGSEKEEKKYGTIQHPEVMYEFACMDEYPLGKAARMPTRFVKRGPNEPRVKKKRCEEIVEYENDFEADECHWPSLEISEDGYNQEQSIDGPQKEISLESLISSSHSNKRQRNRMRKGRKQEEIVVKSKKGNVVNIPQEEFIVVERGLETPNPSMTAKITKTSMEKFYFANQTGSGDGVLFGNIRPVVFAADLTKDENDKPSDYCYLLFETDFNPDVCYEESLHFENTDVPIAISLVCKNKDFVTLFSLHFSEFISKACKTVPDDHTLEDLIVSARNFVSERLLDNKNCCGDGNALPVQKMPENPCLRESKSKRMMHVVRDINKQIGVKMESAFLNTLNLKDFEAELTEGKTKQVVEDEFVLVNHSRMPDNCQICGRNYKEENITGIALEACRHWFCQNCWANQVSYSKQPRVKCPNADCQEEASLVTQMLVNTFVEKRYVDGDATFKCRDRNCSGVTKILPMSKHLKFVAPTMLSCVCGLSWCANCGQDAHGPVSCHVAEGYADEIDSLYNNSKFQVSGKSCPKCLRFFIKECGCPNMKCSCGERFCWTCLYSRDEYSHYCVEPDAPETTYVLSNKFAIDAEMAAKNQLELQKHRKALSSSTFGYRARLRVMKFLSETKDHNVDDQKLAAEFGYNINGKSGTTTDKKHELLSAVEDLLLVKDEMHYIITYVHSAFTYGNVRRAARKLLQNLNGKMETLTSSIEYLLLTRNYCSSDYHSSAMFKTKATQGRRLIRSVFNAFYPPCH